jgi:hypothetical protein
VATLPALRWGESAPVPRAAVLAMAAEWLPAADAQALAALEEMGGMDEVDEGHATHRPAALTAWHAFDTALRNALAVARAARRGLDAAPFLRPGEPLDAATRAVVQDCVKLDDPLKAEQALDQARWAFLDNLCAAHMFDFTALLCYVLKLALLERWQAFNVEAGTVCVHSLLTGVSTT